MRSLYTIGFLYIGVSLYALLIKPAPEMAPTTTAVADFGGDAGPSLRAEAASAILGDVDELVGLDAQRQNEAPKKRGAQECLLGYPRGPT